MTQLTRSRVLVMHGQNLVDAGLAATLSRHAEIEVLEPCTASTTEAVLDWLVAHRVDIMITDYENGLPLAAALRRAQESLHPARTRLMVVTSRATQAEIRAALKYGVAAYLMNTSPTTEVVDAVRNVQMGIRHVSHRLAKTLLDDLQNEQLTPRETDVLRLAAQGFANKVIAARLQVELGTVKCHMRAILEKLRAGNRTEAVVIAQQRGLLASPSESETTPAPANASTRIQWHRRVASTALPLLC